MNRGAVYAHKGNYERAIADYTEAIQLDPESARVFMTRGDAYTNKGDYQRAIADYTETIRLDPKNALAFSDRGVAYTKKGEYDRAVVDFNQAIRLDPKTAHAFSRAASRRWLGHNRLSLQGSRLCLQRATTTESALGIESNGFVEIGDGSACRKRLPHG